MSNNKAFTLIEVIVALTVFVVGIVSLFPFFSGGLQVLFNTEQKMTVVHLARSQMAEIETQGFPETAIDTVRTAFPAPYDNYEYEITWTSLASDIASSSDTVLYRAALTIYWDSRSGEKSETFITYIGRMNPY